MRPQNIPRYWPTFGARGRPFVAKEAYRSTVAAKSDQAQQLCSRRIMSTRDRPCFSDLRRQRGALKTLFGRWYGCCEAYLMWKSRRKRRPAGAHQVRVPIRHLRQVPFALAQSLYHHAHVHGLQKLRAQKTQFHLQHLRQENVRELYGSFWIYVEAN